jgi:acetate---CoA ligase (ADP-forming)
VKSDLTRFLAPRSIAIIGATEGVEKIGGRIMNNLLRHHYDGALYPINRGRDEVYGLTAYRDLASLPGPVDLALVSVPAASVAETVEACADAKIPNLLIASSGFAEESPAGAQLQRRVIELGQRRGLRIAGPNTQGLYNVPRGICATFSPAVGVDPGPKGVRRRIGIVAQSGGLGFSLYNKGRADGLDFSTIVSVGNQGDLETADYAEAIIEDEETKALILFIEALKDPPRFLALAERAADLKKPLIVAKIGRDTAGKRAVASHTGSLSGSETAYDAIFERHGIIRAESAEELLEIAALFTRAPTPRGKRVAVISASGGTGAWLTDICESHGLELPVIDAARQERLKETLPAFGSPLNPIDITAQGLQGYASALEVIVDSPDLDAIIVAISTSQETRLAREGERLVKLVREASKPVLIFSYTVIGEKSKALLAGWDLYAYLRMTGCARALQAGAAYSAFLAARRARSLPPPSADTASRFLEKRGKILCEYQAKELLSAYGIAAPAEKLVKSAAEADLAAAAIGGPVALKVQSPDIPHKTEAKALALNLGDPASVRRAYDTIMAAAQRFAPKAEIHGVLVQAMAPPGLELIAGVNFDVELGPIVMCGLGGIYAEFLGDVAFAPAPLSLADANALIDRLKAAKLVAGARGEPPADRAALAELLVRLSLLARDGADRIAEIDLNPVILYPAGQGLVVVDALIVQKGTP